MPPARVGFTEEQHKLNLVDGRVLLGSALVRTRSPVPSSRVSLSQPAESATQWPTPKGRLKNEPSPQPPIIRHSLKRCDRRPPSAGAAASPAGDAKESPPGDAKALPLADFTLSEFLSGYYVTKAFHIFEKVRAMAASLRHSARSWVA